jgi:hypothetical protein
MYVLSIIWNSILYIGLTYIYVSHIIFCMVLSTWLHTKLFYEGLDNVFALHNFQIPSFKFSQNVFASLQNLFWCLFNVNFCHSNFAKLHHSHMTLDRSEIMGETWKTMSTTISQNFSSIDDDHKELSLSKEINFKIETETLDTWISLNTYSNDMTFLSLIYSFMIYKIPKL